MKDFTSRTAVVTGSARGIGKAIAQRYAALGDNVVINYYPPTRPVPASRRPPCVSLNLCCV